MFKRLKQKIDNGDNPASQEGTPGRKADDGRRSSRSLNAASNLKKTDSLSSLNSEDMVRKKTNSLWIFCKAMVLYFVNCICSGTDMKRCYIVSVANLTKL